MQLVFPLMINHNGMQCLNMQHFSFNLLLRFGIQSFINTLYIQNMLTGYDFVVLYLEEKTVYVVYVNLYFESFISIETILLCSISRLNKSFKHIKDYCNSDRASYCRALFVSINQGTDKHPHFN